MMPAMEQRAPSTTLLPFSPDRRYTLEEYFRLEGLTDERLEFNDGYVRAASGEPIEFRDGQIVAMSGGSVNHSRIVSNVNRSFGNRLAGGPCETFDPGLRVRLNRRGRYVHPDVTVVCGPVQTDPDDERGQTVINPRLIVEVLSPSTELHDRTIKAADFREVASLQAYLLISQEQPRVEPYYRNADGVWSFGTAVVDPAGTVELPWLGIELPMAEVYARVAFPPPPADTPSDA